MINEISDVESPLVKELIFVSRKYRASEDEIKLIKTRREYTVALKPTDPDFTHNYIHYIYLKIEIKDDSEPGGAGERLLITATDDNLKGGALEWTTIEYINHQISDKLLLLPSIINRTSTTSGSSLGGNLLRTMLRWVDRQLESMITASITKCDPPIEGEEGGSGQDCLPAAASGVSPTKEGESLRTTSDELWTVDQQAELNTALQLVSPTIGFVPRWQLIGSKVAGKTARECLLRYMDIYNALLAKYHGHIAEEHDRVKAAAVEEAERYRVEEERRLQLSKCLYDSHSIDGSTAIGSGSGDGATVNNDGVEKDKADDKDVADGSEIWKQYEWEYNNEGEGSGGGEEEVDTMLIPFPSTSAYRGTLIKAVGVTTKGGGAMGIELMKLQLRCLRCKEPHDATLHPARVYNSSCAKCAVSFQCMYRPVLLVNGTSNVGFIDVEGAIVSDYLPSTFTVYCLNCTNGSAAFMDQQRALDAQRFCNNCGKTINLCIDTFKIYVITREISSGDYKIDVENLKSKKVRLREEGIVQGKPLPDYGSCSHYKKSYRWFRFPCCGKAFACDDCHDEKSDHSSEISSRMICGGCSHEQSCTRKAECARCGFNMVNVTAAKSYWEGGSGQRNVARMSNNDPHKYKGRNKTVSRKAVAEKEKK